MSRWDPGDFAMVGLVGSLAILVVAAVAFLLWSGVQDRHDETTCRDRGGNVERVLGGKGDWRCVGARAEVQP